MNIFVCHQFCKLGFFLIKTTDIGLKYIKVNKFWFSFFILRGCFLLFFVFSMFPFVPGFKSCPRRSFLPWRASSVGVGFWISSFLFLRSFVVTSCFLWFPIFFFWTVCILWFSIFWAICILWFSLFIFLYPFDFAFCEFVVCLAPLFSCSILHSPPLSPFCLLCHL